MLQLQLLLSLCVAHMLTATGTATATANLRPRSRVDGNGEPQACDNTNIEINDQKGIDFYSKCPRFTPYSFKVNDTFVGPFAMPGIESLPSFEAGLISPEYTGDTRIKPRVTSISMPDLRETVAGNLDITNINTLTSISFPKLELINGSTLKVMGCPNLTNLTFPSLKTVVHLGIILEGSFEVINFPSLISTKSIYIRSTSEKLDCRALGKELGPRVNSSLLVAPYEYWGLDGGPFTCGGGGEGNWFNISDTRGEGSGGGSGSGSGSAAGDSDKKNGAGLLGVEYGLVTTLLLGLLWGVLVFGFR